MATFTCNDIEGFVMNMSEIARLPDETIADILEAGAKVVQKAHVEAISSNFRRRTGRLIGSPKIKMSRKGGSTYALIYPQGTHHTYHARSGGSGVAGNAEVGFVHEFGGHGNAAKAWMLNANEKCAESMAKAEEQVYDKFLASHNL